LRRLGFEALGAAIVRENMAKTVFRIEIELGNDAMKDIPDILRALAQQSSRLRELADSGEERKILDVNGNSVGKVGFYQE
jgi:hypothetical protein